MKCFKIGWAAESEGGLPYQWSRNNTLQGVFRAPFSEDEWTPPQDIRFEHGGPKSYGALLRGGRLTEATKAELAKLWCITQPKTRLSRETVGCFSRLLDDLPLVSDRLKAAIEEHDFGLFEFVKVEKIWNTNHDCQLNGGPFYFANLLARVDSLDKQASEIQSIPRFDGTSFNLVNDSRSLIAGNTVQSASIWRDSVVAEVYCTGSFRELLEAAGCNGWSFTEIPVVPC
jgi:hypothetical protein